MNTSETDYAWVAGFLDGEGCFSIGKLKSSHKGRSVRNASYTSCLGAAQLIPEPLCRLRAICGGQIYTAGKGGYSQWNLRGRNIVPVIDKIFPYLTKHKAKQALAILSFERIRKAHRCNPLTTFELGLKDWYWYKLKELKKTSYRAAS